MASKRSRAAFEADLQAQQSPYVIYGTPLPPLDPDTRDDGSYVPVWKQEVTDEKGRKRLHGAFTGGFSAGYFNTVGSKEGWTPSTFVSSRSNRKKDEPREKQRPEDFMDDEDLAEAEEARKLQTRDTFAGFGTNAGTREKDDGLMGLLRPSGETMGVKLLKKMGWREGQGIGPKIRRQAKDEDGQDDDAGETHLFAPENSKMIQFIRKTDKKGLGYEGEQGLERPQQAQDQPHSEHQNGGSAVSPATHRTSQNGATPKTQVRGGFGVGVLNDDGSDEDDPYSMGPQLSYNRVVGGAKKKTKKKAALAKPGANPSLNNKPIFISKKSALAKGNPGFRRCHDGRLPIDGFILSTLSDALASIMSQDEKYPPPEVPAGWKPSRAAPDSHTDTPDPSQGSSKLNPTSRAAILGEAPLPGKSIFDYLSPAARDRLAAATGKKALPPGKGERFVTPSKPERTTSTIPSIPKEIALAALGRGTGGWLPYNDNPSKRSRYEAYLRAQSEIQGDADTLTRPAGIRSDEWIKELEEFAHAATIFKPMTGAMASRFTSAASHSSSSVPADSTSPSQNDNAADNTLLRHPSAKPRTPAEEAAAAGMYGPLTRTIEQWFPTRLLCKRFNVQPPTHVPPDSSSKGRERAGSGGGGSDIKPTHSTALPGKQLEILGKKDMDELRKGTRFMSGGLEGGTAGAGEDSDARGLMEVENEEVMIDVERNEAIEGERPEERLFKDIFGSDSEDE